MENFCHLLSGCIRTRSVEEYTLAVKLKSSNRCRKKQCNKAIIFYISFTHFINREWKRLGAFNL
jgi:hypothetical protein